MNNERIYQLIIEDPRDSKSSQIADLGIAMQKFLKRGGKVVQIDRGVSGNSNFGKHLNSAQRARIAADGEAG